MIQPRSQYNSSDYLSLNNVNANRFMLNTITLSKIAEKLYNFISKQSEDLKTKLFFNNVKQILINKSRVLVGGGESFLIRYFMKKPFECSCLPSFSSGPIVLRLALSVKIVISLSYYYFISSDHSKLNTSGSHILLSETWRILCSTLSFLRPFSLCILPGPVPFS